MDLIMPVPKGWILQKIVKDDRGTIFNGCAGKTSAFQGIVPAQGYKPGIATVGGTLAQNLDSAVLSRFSNPGERDAQTINTNLDNIIRASLDIGFFREHLCRIEKRGKRMHLLGNPFAGFNRFVSGDIEHGQLSFEKHEQQKRGQEDISPAFKNRYIFHSLLVFREYEQEFIGKQNPNRTHQGVDA
ncbi:MAG: hypothetical protein WCX13_01305 [Candidatus Hydrogenedentales bacterium]